MEFIKRAAGLMVDVALGKAGPVGPLGFLLQAALQVFVLLQLGLGVGAAALVSVVLVATHVGVAFLLGYVTVLRVATLNSGGGKKVEYPLSAQLKTNAILGGCLNVMLSSVVFIVVTLFGGGWSALPLLLLSALGGTVIDVAAVALFFKTAKNRNK